jgi:lysozyme
MTGLDQQLLREQLIVHEGKRWKPYTDTMGKLTIGVGHNLTDNGLSDAMVMALLDEDIAEAETDLATFSWWAGLSSVRQRALIDIRFNLGADRFRLFKQMIHAVAVGNFIGARQQLIESRWSTQVSGARRDRLQQMLAEGTDPCAES